MSITETLPGPLDLACLGYGAIPARIMWVGISAGRRGALISKVPLTKDASGRLFLRAMSDLGYTESDEFSEAPVFKDCYVTNLVKGRCVTINGQNRLPTENEIDFWFPGFYAEYLTVKPQMIVCLGRLVCDAIWKRWPERDADGLMHLWGKLRIVKHPRWYASHGALAGKYHKAFLDMTWAYRMATF